MASAPEAQALPPESSLEHLLSEREQLAPLPAASARARVVREERSEPFEIAPDENEFFVDVAAAGAGPIALAAQGILSLHER